MAIHILASQLIEILAQIACFTTNNGSPSTILLLEIYNDLPADFNYFQITRNGTSFNFNSDTTITFLNDDNDSLKNAVEAAYPEYTYA